MTQTAALQTRPASRRSVNAARYAISALLVGAVAGGAVVVAAQDAPSEMLASADRFEVARRVDVDVSAATTTGVVATSTATMPASIETPQAPDPIIDMPPMQASTTDSKVPATTVPPPVDVVGPITSPDDGDHCAASLNAADLTDFFAGTIGEFQGADYQRTIRLSDDRVLWTFQDAFISGRLVHNAAMIQSGRCFSLLNEGARSWLFADITSNMSRWHWIFDGGHNADGETVSLFVAEMAEQGASYLSVTTPVALRRVVIDTTTFETVDVTDETVDGVDLYGWSVTDDGEYSYLFSHCYRQFGHGPFGFADCAVDTKVARIPFGDFAAAREYWDGTEWSGDPAVAVNIVDGLFIVPTGYGPLPSTNNAVQVRFNGEHFEMVSNPGDWFGNIVFTATAPTAAGPWTVESETTVTPKCDDSQIAQGCNTYWASWVPWNGADGEAIWSIGHNTWNGGATHSNLWVYRPTFETTN